MGIDVTSEGDGGGGEHVGRLTLPPHVTGQGYSVNSEGAGSPAGRV